MKALILSAGQGSRLLPLTATRPKCLLSLAGKSVLEWQIHQLAACGIRTVTVVVGFAASKVEEVVVSCCPPGLEIRTIYNSLFDVADNLVSCWAAREVMDDDFILLNGDTLFEAAVPQRLLSSDLAPVALATTRKQTYDADDMKVHCDGGLLLGIGKDLPPQETDAESVGMVLFRGDGPRLFRQALEAAIVKQGAARKWYLSVINEMAARGLVWTVSVDGLQWTEIDFPHDLQAAADLVASWRKPEQNIAFVTHAHSTAD